MVPSFIHSHTLSRQCGADTRADKESGQDGGKQGRMGEGRGWPLSEGTLGVAPEGGCCCWSKVGCM